MPHCHTPVGAWPAFTVYHLKTIDQIYGEWIKIIKTRGKINLVADARDECEVLRSLDHPNIMKMWVRGGR